MALDTADLCSGVYNRAHLLWHHRAYTNCVVVRAEGILDVMNPLVGSSIRCQVITGDGLASETLLNLVRGGKVLYELGSIYLAEKIKLIKEELGFACRHRQYPFLGRRS